MASVTPSSQVTVTELQRPPPPKKKKSGPIYMREHSMWNNNQILQDDETSCEANFYTVDHEWWRAICLR